MHIRKNLFDARGIVGYAEGMAKNKKNALENYLNELYSAGMMGDEEAQLELINFYVTETDLPLPDMAKVWLTQLAEKGIDQARRCYFSWAMSGDKGNFDWLKLEQWALEMVKTTPDTAYCMLGMLYEPNLPGFDDAKVAEAHYRKAVELGNAGCGFYLARVILGTTAEDSEPDYEEIRRLLEAAVEVNGSAPVYDMLGSVCLWMGDDEAAAKCFQKVHRLAPDNAECCLNLAYLYARGGGVRQNDEIALRYFQKAANLGSPIGTYMVGSYYYDGLGARRNAKRAVDYMKRALDLGMVEALYMLGACYMDGDGVRADVPTALNYWEQGAEEKMADCCAALVRYYLEDAEGAVDISKVEALLATARENLQPDDEQTSEEIELAQALLKDRKGEGGV